MSTSDSHLPVAVRPGRLATPVDGHLVPALIADEGELGRLALYRILHRQHPQSEHAPGLRASLPAILRLVRRSRANVDHDPAVRRRHLYRDAPADPFAARREAAARRRAHAVRLADHRPGHAGKPGVGRARPEACGENRQDAGARRPGLAQAARTPSQPTQCAICATVR